ncbi:MAG: hypothetical protein LBC23_01265 [Coriobacteriales bacterium]|jgi:X-X-X-Leu-X-X-Gly heptad repeat protein|nr:hypothetical protein [Coriobacteriales bacterium]
MNTKPRICGHIVLALLLAASFVPLAGWVGNGASVAEVEEAAAAASVAASSAETDSDDDAAAETTAGSLANSPAARIGEKEEIVYALLNETGTPRSGYVINHFQVDGAGTLTDHGAYSMATNLSTIAPLALKDRDVSVAVEQGDFYYEGVLSSVALPWFVDISYTLDGVSVEPEQLAGATGELGIHIKTRQNPEVDPVFFKNYLLQVQLTLDAEKTRSLKAPDATVAVAGANQQIAFMVLPGKDGDLQLTAQVTDFEMPGIQLSGLPFSMVFDVPDTTEIVDDMATLADAIGALDEGVGKLQSGVADMQTGATDLASGSADINKGLSLLSENSTNITSASAQVDAALAKIVRQLEAGAVDPSDLERLIGGLQELSKALHNNDPLQPGLAEGLAQAQGNLAYLTSEVNSIVMEPTPVSEDEIDALYDVMSSIPGKQQPTVEALIDLNEDIADIQGYWAGGLKPGFDSVAEGLGKASGTCQYLAGTLDTITAELESELKGVATDLKTLTSSLKSLSGNYSAFNEGLTAYTEGVDTIATNYQTFNGGLAQFTRGVGSLYGGVADLRGGTSELYANVEDLPTSVQEQIDSFLADYQKSDFTPVSFTAPNNEKVERVQFVLTTAPIKIPAPENDAATDVPVEKSFWDRLKALFE